MCVVSNEDPSNSNVTNILSPAQIAPILCLVTVHITDTLDAI